MMTIGEDKIASLLQQLKKLWQVFMLTHYRCQYKLKEADCPVNNEKSSKYHACTVKSLDSTGLSFLCYLCRTLQMQWKYLPETSI